MKIVFFGTPDYVLPILTTLHKRFVTGPGKSPIAAVVTSSPKPFGRKQILTYSPIDKWAHERGIKTFYSAKDLLDQKVEANLGVLASYGEIIPEGVINLFPQGILVIHPSLLPKYRGASPVPAAIANGDEKTGVTIFKMDKKVDHGPIISQFKEDILSNDTSDVLRNRLFERSAEVLAELIEPYIKGKITPKVQNDEDATFTKIMKKEDGYIDLTRGPLITHERFIRAMYPWPCAWTRLPDQRRLKLLPNGMVQLEGKNPVTVKQFLSANSQFSHLFANA